MATSPFAGKVSGNIGKFKKRRTAGTEGIARAMPISIAIRVLAVAVVRVLVLVQAAAAAAAAVVAVALAGAAEVLKYH